MQGGTNRPVLKPVIPKSGLVFTDKNIFNEIVCKPKLLALKSLTLQKLEDMEKALLHQNAANPKKPDVGNF
jgi:hypothetical protein